MHKHPYCFHGILALLLWAMAGVATAATTPDVILYEGRLLDNNSNALTTAHTLRFSFWKSANNASGDITATGAINIGASNYGEWNEEKTVTPNSNGIFSVALGSGTSLPTIDFEKHKFLQVEVKASGGADTDYEVIDPDTNNDSVDRMTIGSLPYSENSEALDHYSSGTASGNILVLRASALLRAPANVDVVGTLSGAVLHSETSITASGALSVEGASTFSGTAIFNQDSNAINFRIESDNVENMFFVDGTNDRVGIGTSSPTTTLEVVGTASGDILHAQKELTSSGSVIIEEGNTVRINSVTYTFPPSDGVSSGWVLKTDASGTLSWAQDDGGIAQADADNRYVNISGDTMTGALVINDESGADAGLDVVGTMSGTSLQVTGTGATPIMYTDQTTGRVGIGTASPTATLSLGGQINWVTGLGAITQILGPSDQDFDIVADAPAQAASTTAGNAITLTASNATAGSSESSAAAGGAITITGGDGTRYAGGATSGGAVTITAGGGSTAVTGGAINITGGEGQAGGGDVNITSGNTNDVNSQVAAGSIMISTPDQTTGLRVPGDITIQAGDASPKSSGGTGIDGGVLSIIIGDGGNYTTTGTGGDGGAWTLTGGAGGDATGAGGTHTGGVGSALTLTSGAGGSATGGSGTREGGDSGDIIFQVGAVGTGADENGTLGTIQLLDANVGIGTATPSEKLDVAGTMSGEHLYISGTGATPELYTDSGKVGIGTASPEYALTVNKASPSANELLFAVQNNGTNKFSADEDGDVVIGGGLQVTGTVIGGGLQVTGTVTDDLVMAAAKQMQFQTDEYTIEGAEAAKGWQLEVRARGGINFVALVDMPDSNIFSFNSNSGIEMTDADAEQSWLYIVPKINQSSTAAYNGLKINVLETAIGDGSTGDGNNLFNAAIEGVSKFVINRTGNTGIGTTSPSEKLDVAGTMSGEHLYISGTGASPILMTNPDERVGIGTANPGTTLDVVGTMSGSHIRSASGMIVYSGRVGIGTASPSTELQVNGTISSIDSNNNFLRITADSASGVFDIASNDGAGTNDLRIYGTTGGGDALNLYLLDGVLKVDGTGDSYFTGNVGIGTTSPGTKLDVVGTMSGSAITDSSGGAYTGAAACYLANGVLGHCTSADASSCGCTAN